MTTTDSEDPRDEDEQTAADPLPAEADPADVEEQRREVGDEGEDDYR
ncbi:hypothetical protein ACQHIV_40400 [Kribbella sp. GL6]